MLLEHVLFIPRQPLSTGSGARMDLTYTPEQQRLREELRAYFARLMTPDRRAALTTAEGEYGNGEAYREVVRELGRDGWLVLSWPEEFGGRGASPLDQLIFTDEAAVAGVPVPFLTLHTVGPTIMRFGTAEQKAHYLPRIAGGEIHFSIGYSEPEAGTDLASLRTRAVRDAGGSYVVNGQKMWTSLIQYADYVWLACRTDPDAPRHKGLSILIVPTDSAGFSWTPDRKSTRLNSSHLVISYAVFCLKKKNKLPCLHTSCKPHTSKFLQTT